MRFHWMLSSIVAFALAGAPIAQADHPPGIVVKRASGTVVEVDVENSTLSLDGRLFLVPTSLADVLDELDAGDSVDLEFQGRNEITVLRILNPAQ